MKSFKPRKPGGKTAAASGHVEAAAASGHVEAATRRKQHARDWKPAINGGRCCYDAYRGPRGNSYDNWTLQCHRHENCERTRGVMASSTKRYGELEPLAFLHAWRDMAVPPGKPHRRCNPKLEDVSRFVDTNLQELADLNAAFRV